eukprot:311959_1
MLKRIRLSGTKFMKRDQFDVNKCRNLFVIGSGFGRTGTLSVQVALQHLGFNAYHSSDLAQHKQHHILWSKAADLKMNKIRENNATSFNDWNTKTCVLNDAIPNEFNWDNIFETKTKHKYNACFGGLSVGFCFDLFHFYKQKPYNYDCKVILTKRENEDIWFKSVTTSIGKLQSTIADNWFLKQWFGHKWYNVVHKTFCEMVLDDASYKSMQNKTNCTQKYVEWNNAIITSIPNDKLLVFHPGDGWEPLCKFLNVDVPDIPFPRVNETKTVEKTVKILRIVGFVINGVVTIIGIAFCVTLGKYYLYIFK